MTKTRLALVTAILTAPALLASTAEAGKRVQLQFGYPLGTFTAHGNSGGSSSYSKYRKPRHHTVRRRVEEKVKVSKEPTPTQSVAETNPETETKKIKAETENSSISTAAATSLQETGSPAEPSSAGTKQGSALKTDCKKFFPSVGMTLTVPCE